MPGTLMLASSTLAALPTTGAAWTRLTAKSTTDPGTGNLGTVDQTHPAAVLSIALRWAKDAGGLGKQYVIDEIKAVMGTEAGAGQPLNPFRTIGAYIMAADLVDMPGSTVGANGQTFNAWIQSLPYKVIPGQTNWNTLHKCAQTAGNNWGACARTSTLACALWMLKEGINPTGVPSGDPSTAVALRNAVIAYFKRWLGDTSVPNTFGATGSFNSAWAISTFPTSQGVINAATADLTRTGANVEDASRTSGGPPLKSGDGIHYQYECLDSALVMINLLINAGYTDAAGWGNSAVKRNYLFMKNNTDAAGNALWTQDAGVAQYHHFFWMQPHAANWLYPGLGMPVITQDGSQRRMLTTHTDWLTSTNSTWMKVAASGGTPTIVNPAVSFTITRTNQSVTVNAAGSSAGSSTIVRHEITWGDGSATQTITEPTRTATHAYSVTQSATFTITVRVVATDGGAASATQTVTIPGVNGAPVAAFTITPTTGAAPLTVSYDFTGSFDANSDPITYIVDWGDGTTVSNAPLKGTHVYTDVTDRTSYTVTGKASDGTLTSDPAIRTVTVAPAATSTVAGTVYITIGGTKVPIGGPGTETALRLAANQRGRILYLDGANGSNSNNGLARSASWATFAYALQQLAPGDTLLVEPGTYNEDLRSLTIAAGTKQRPITVQTRPNPANAKAVISGLLWLTAPSWWTLRNLNVTWRNGVGDATTHMVKVTDGIGWTLDGCEFSGAQSYAQLLVTSVDGTLDAWTVRRCYIHDNGTVNAVNQDHNVYVNTGLSQGWGLIERCLLTNAPNGNNLKLDGASAGVGSKNVTVRYNTLAAANDQNILIGSGSSGNRVYRNLIVGNNFRAVRGFNLDGLGNRVYKNWGHGGAQGGTLFSFSDSGYHGLEIGAGNQYGDPTLVGTTLGYDGYRATAQTARGYGHHASEGLDDADATTYTQTLAPLALPTGSALQANLSGNVTLLQDNPDTTPDTSWMTSISHTTETRVTVTFPTPLTLVNGSGLQRIRARVRRTTGTVMPTIYLQLLENGTLVRSLTSVTNSLSATPEQELVGTFALSELADPTGAGVQVRIISTPGTSGDCTGEVAAIAWDAVITTPAPTASAGGTSGAATPIYAPQPTDQGLKAWTMDPATATAAQILVSGTVYLSRMSVPVAATITNLCVYCSTAGASLTVGVLGIYDQAGNLLAQTGDQSTDLATTGAKTYALTTPLVLPSGTGWVYAAALVVGTTGPTLARQASTTNAAVTNIGLTAAPYRVATKASQTALPSALGTTAASNVSLLIAAS